jgi:hypothetical protein
MDLPVCQVPMMIGDRWTSVFPSPRDSIVFPLIGFVEAVAGSWTHPA